MEPQPTFYTLYRQTSIGLSLADSIDTLIGEGKITQRVAYSVMLQFDRIMAQSLQEKVKTTLTMKGKVDTYRFCDEVWTFVVEDVSLRFADRRSFDEVMNVPSKIRVVACNSDMPPLPE